MVSTDPDTQGKVAFEGRVALDRDTWIGESVAHLDKQGAANPVRYVTASLVTGATTGQDEPAGTGAAEVPESAVAEGDLVLLLRVNKTWHEGIRADHLYEGSTAPR